MLWRGWLYNANKGLRFISRGNRELCGTSHKFNERKRRNDGDRYVGYSASPIGRRQDGEAAAGLASCFSPAGGARREILAALSSIQQYYIFSSFPLNIEPFIGVCRVPSRRLGKRLAGWALLHGTASSRILIQLWSSRPASFTFPRFDPLAFLPSESVRGNLREKVVIQDGKPLLKPSVTDNLSLACASYHSREAPMNKIIVASQTCYYVLAKVNWVDYHTW